VRHRVGTIGNRASSWLSRTNSPRSAPFLGRRAGIDDEVYEFTDFEWLYSCSIEDKDGKGIGNAWGMCELTFQVWLKVLADHGIAV
jgi:hypothetical protein